MKEPKTLAQMAAEAAGGAMQIAGKPADVCPYCGCALLANKTQTGQDRITRWVYCRNEKCVDAAGKRRRFVSRQPKPELVREITKSEEVSSSGKDGLSLYKESA